ncbi:hypothetical protein ACFV2U_40445 [Streptomyces sp. NPDC059697]|uniref:hypothetical protein n=1 Tax=Streptomyces sp. NPDC059697 TaxID=3346912 RepID=UPI0036C38B63
MSGGSTRSLDPDLDRSIDQFGILAENAASLGMETTVEASPGLTVPVVSRFVV